MAPEARRGAALLAAAALALAALGGAWLLRAADARSDQLLARVRKSEDRASRELHQLARQQVAASLRAEGYQRWFVADPPAPPAGCPRFLFAAHVYPKSGAIDVEYPDLDRALESFLHAQQALAPERVYFGGDSIERPGPRGLAFLASLRERVPNARFVVGNHEAWWKPEAAAVREWIGARHGSEAIGPARVIWLHSVMENGAYGLDAEESAFLERSLAQRGEAYPVVLMHHALWAGDTWLVNKDYANAADARADWMQRVLPLLARHETRLVLLGDSGVRQAGSLTALRGIPHATTGWSAWARHIPADWLSVDLCADGPHVARHVAFEGSLWVHPEWPPAAAY